MDLKVKLHLPDTIMYLHTKFHVNRPISLGGVTVPKMAKKLPISRNQCAVNCNNVKELQVENIPGHKN